MSSPDRTQSADPCPECDVGSFTRNHYFTGKLMQVGDFDAEQRYGVDKLRLHHRLLHGWGVACGLKVKQHAQASCQARFVCVEPGVAIDCCGNEIVLPVEDCVDITRLAAVKALIDQKDTNTHVLQICIRYRECPTEEVPVFYDDCGCDRDRCAPNRILESYDFDAVIDPKTTACSPGDPKLNWLSTINPGGANGVAVAAGPPGYLYAISNTQSTAFQIETQHYAIVGTAPLPTPGQKLAVSPDGTRLYVVTGPASTSKTGLAVLNVFDTSKPLAGPAINQFEIPESDQGRTVLLAVGTDQRLLSLIGATGDIYVWPTSIASTTSPTSSFDSKTNLGSGLSGLVISGDGTQAFTADTTNNRIAVLNIQTGSGSGAGAPLANLPASFAPTDLAVLPGTGSVVLAAIGGTGVASQLTLVNPAGTGSFPVVSLAQIEVGLVVSPDGRWAYVLQEDGNTQGGSIQTVDLAGLRLQKTVTPGRPVSLGFTPWQVAISPTGNTLYVAFGDAGTPQQPGGIAVIGVSEADCPDILWRSLDGCPHCGHPNCVVLATIDGYRAGFSIEDPTDPPSDPGTDAKDSIARIDNRKGRRILPSVQALREWFECVQASIVGAPGPAGPAGPKGDPGPGVEQGLTQILKPSWTHNADMQFKTALVPIVPIGQKRGLGLLIQFSGPVKIADPNHPIDDHVFEVLGREPKPSPPSKGCLCPVNGLVFPVAPDPKNSNILTQVDPTKFATAETIAFFFTLDQAKHLTMYNELWVRFRGDFVLDANGLAVDVQFVRAALPTGQRPGGTKFGIEGGTFESWFWLSAKSGSAST